MIAVLPGCHDIKKQLLLYVVLVKGSYLKLEVQCYVCTHRDLGVITFLSFVINKQVLLSRFVSF